LEHAVFGAARPRAVVVTTPNAEYNRTTAHGLGPGLRLCRSVGRIRSVRRVGSIVRVRRLGVDRVVEFRLGHLVRLGEPCQGAANESRAPSQVAPRDQFAVRVFGQPRLARAQQLLDLARVDPVVLRAVEDRQQHVQLAERVGHPLHAGERDVAVP